MLWLALFSSLVLSWKTGKLLMAFYASFFFQQQPTLNSYRSVWSPCLGVRVVMNPLHIWHHGSVVLPCCVGSTNTLMLHVVPLNRKIAPWSSRWFEEILISLTLIMVTFLSKILTFFTQHSQLGNSFGTHTSGTKWNFYTLFHNNMHIKSK